MLRLAKTLGNVGDRLIDRLGGCGQHLRVVRRVAPSSVHLDLRGVVAHRVAPGHFVGRKVDQLTAAHAVTVVWAQRDKSVVLASRPHRPDAQE